MKTLQTFKYLAGTCLILLIFGCGSSTGSRYNDNAGKNGENKKEIKIPEDFDITPYKTKIEIKQKTKPVTKESIEAWYDYSNSGGINSGNKTVVSTVNGYRVRVSSTEKLDEAESLRSELFTKTNQKQIYIIFDPPFYRVEIGDFTDISSARDLRFKLNQLGYSEARVVSEKINIYK